MKFEIIWSRHSFNSTVMANSTSVLPRVLSRTLVSTPKPGNQHILRISQPPSQCRRFHSSPLRKEEKLSFRGQLYESTAQRLARERAEEARFAEARNAAGNSTLRLFATTFGMQGPHSWPSRLGVPRNRQLISLSSHSRRLRDKLLLRHPRTKRTPHNFHHTSRCGPAAKTRYARLGDASCVGGLCADSRERKCIYK